MGASLAYLLASKGHHVIVVDQRAAAFDNLPQDFHGRIVQGDVLARHELHQAEIESADALAALTGSDSLNALVAHIARQQYHVPRGVARNLDPRQLPLQQAFRIPIVGALVWEGQQILELLTGQEAAV